MHVAALAPKRVKGLVLVDGSCGPADPGDVKADLLRTTRDGQAGFAESILDGFLMDGVSVASRSALVAEVMSMPRAALVSYWVDMGGMGPGQLPATDRHFALPGDRVAEHQPLRGPACIARACRSSTPRAMAGCLATGTGRRPHQR